MNEFTKEELIALFLEVNIAIRHWGEAEEYKNYPKLKDKIQSMIDNYCEHEFREYPLGVTAIPFCNKCKKAVL